jgi:hypothetical protein
MTIQCCVCKRERIDGEWCETTRQGLPDASHTYCPSCLNDAVEMIRREALEEVMAS